MPTSVLRLPESLRAWGSARFAGALKAELAAADPAALPLQHGLAGSSVALADDLGVMVIGSEDGGGCIRARVGIFYQGILAGCSCADDPTPVEAQHEYCEVVVEIDKRTACATCRPAD